MKISINWVVFAVKTVTLLWKQAKAPDIARECHSSTVICSWNLLYSHYDYQETSAGLGNKHSTPDTWVEEVGQSGLFHQHPVLRWTRCIRVLFRRTQKRLWTRVFEQWRVERNRATSDDGEMCPSNLLQCPVQVSLNYWLSRFVVEARREDGQPYPPTSISNLLAGLYRECRKYDPNCPNFMNRKDPTFKELNGALQVMATSQTKSLANIKEYSSL